MTIESMLLRDEGLALMPYHDTRGILTIGVGRAIGRVGITRGEALYLLNNDIGRVQRELRACLPVYAVVDPIRQTVLENMAFNLGTAGVCEFRRMIAALGEGQYARAAREMLSSSWARQVGDRALRLADLMAHGTITQRM